MRDASSGTGHPNGKDGGTALSPRGLNPPGTSWVPPLAVAVGAVLVYLNSLTNGFAFDDLPLIVVNPAVQGPGGLLTAWLDPYWPGPDALARGLYRPLTTFLFALQWRLGGGAPFLFHLSNLLLHAGASLLVYLLLRELLGWREATAGGVLFAVHPVHVEAVANGVGQAEVVSSALALLAVVLWARRPRNRAATPGLLAFLALLYLGAVLAKENAIVLPALFLALDVAQGRDRDPGYPGSAVRQAFPLLAVAGAYLLARFAALEGSLTGDAAFDLPFLWDPGTRFLTALSVWPEYLRLLAFPLHLSAMYDPATLVPAVGVTPRVLLGGLLLLTTLACAGLRRTWPGLGLGAAWFLLTLLPVSNLLVPVGTLLAERTLYLPSVALSLWVAFGMRRALEWEGPRFRWRLALLAVFASVTLVLGARSALRNRVWANNDVLFQTTLKDHPENFRAQWFEALRFVEAGDPAGSLPHWERAYEIFPWSPSFLTAYADFLLRHGALDAADGMAARSLELRPDSPNGIIVKGMIEIARGQPEEARGRIEALEDLGFPEMARGLEERLREERIR